MNNWTHIDRALQLLALAYAEHREDFPDPDDFLREYLAITHTWRPPS